MVHSICLALFPILLGKTIACCVRDIHRGGAGFDHGFNHPRQVVVIGTARIFGVKFHIVRKIPRPFDALNRPFQDFLAGAVEFSFDMIIGSADSGMDPGPPGMLERFGGAFDVFQDGTAEPADGCVADNTGDFRYRFEVARTGNRETGFDNIHPQGFQGQGNLNLFLGIELAAGNLLTVAQRSIENVNFVCGHMAWLGIKKQAVKIISLAGNNNCLQPAEANVPP